MKKGFLATYAAGIIDMNRGESYSKILYYLVPEMVTTFLMVLPFWLDAIFIGQLNSTPTYATLGVTNNLFHLIMKVSEAFLVGTVVLVGQFNGMHAYKNVGHTVRDAFWVTAFLGLAISATLYMGANAIFGWYGVSPEILDLGVPFLRLRALGVFLTFIYFALVGFLRGIKNTQAPMFFSILGSAVFIITDYLLVFGKFGFPCMGLMGSALASFIQYTVMLIAALAYLIFDKHNRQYQISLFSGFFEQHYVLKLISLSWPVIIDKATLAVAYIWLCKVLCPLGTCTIATFCLIKDLERLAFLPAVASAQVITFLVSNDFGVANWNGIKENIKKIILLASLFVGTLVIIFSFFIQDIVYLFDKSGSLTPIVAKVFPLLGALIFFDIIQIILSGALRGAGNVRMVMMVRLIICCCYFGPLSYLMSRLPIESHMVKLLLVYGSFYSSSALMGLIYIRRFRGEEWKKPILKGTND